MTVLPAILVLLLGTFVVWFFWPIVVDPFSRGVARRTKQTEADSLADTLFDVWSNQGGRARAFSPSRHS
jgi:hypothetical protein